MKKLSKLDSADWCWEILDNCSYGDYYKKHFENDLQHAQKIAIEKYSMSYDLDYLRTEGKKIYEEDFYE